jgi:SAM-dependent methyltransferase
MIGRPPYSRYYMIGRPPYSRQLLAVLRREFGLGGGGLLLDVGCGPGARTLELAPAFDGSVGLDPDPGMLSEARRQDEEPHLHEADLRASRFGAGRTVYAAGRPDVVRTADSVVAGYYSTSYAFAAPRRCTTLGLRRRRAGAAARALSHGAVLGLAGRHRDRAGRRIARGRSLRRPRPPLGRADRSSERPPSPMGRSPPRRA